jgi:ubiquinone/menaquinone biosynthesis C-methylase UbiE
MADNIRYVHEEIVHNFKAANEVVPFIVELLNPKSIVDVGCGIGTWLKVFEDIGVGTILGIDGSYVDKKLLKIGVDKFVDFDLEPL